MPPSPPYFGTILTRRAVEQPGAELLIAGERRVCYGELVDEAELLAGLLVESGLSREERVGILCERGVEQILGIFAVALAGGAFVVLSTQLKASQIAHIVDDCAIHRVLTTSSQVRLLREIEVVRRGAPFAAWILDGGEVDVDGGGGGRHEPISRWVDLRTSASRCSPVRPILADDLATIIYTSGSTGRPKGVVLPHRNLVEGAEIVSGYLGIDARDRLLGVLPFNFDYGLNQLISAVYQGAALVLHDYFLPRDLVALLAKEEVTVFAGLRPIWLSFFRGRFALKLTEGDDPGDIPPLPALRALTNTGGRIPSGVLGDLQRAFPEAAIFLMYGLTEAFRSTYLPPEEVKRRPTSIGKAIPGVEVFAVDDEGHEVGPGVEGELVHRGALVARGYWNDPEATAHVFRPNPRHRGQDHLAERVVYSGDRVICDEEGFFFFVGRADALIKVSGHRVSPQEVEEAILEMCHASQAIAFGVEHDDERDTSLIVVLEASPDTIELSDLRRLLRQRLPRHMLPSEIVIEERLPRTASGKIDRADLATRYRRALRG